MLCLRSGANSFLELISLSISHWLKRGQEQNQHKSWLKPISFVPVQVGLLKLIGSGWDKFMWERSFNMQTSGPQAPTFASLGSTVAFKPNNSNVTTTQKTNTGNVPTVQAAQGSVQSAVPPPTFHPRPANPGQQPASILSAAPAKSQPQIAQGGLIETLAAWAIVPGQWCLHANSLIVYRVVQVSEEGVNTSGFSWQMTVIAGWMTVVLMLVSVASQGRSITAYIATETGDWGCSAVEIPATTLSKHSLQMFEKYSAFGADTLSFHLSQVWQGNCIGLSYPG